MTESTPANTATPADQNTGAGLIAFLDTAIAKGWLNVGSVKALRTASLKILEVEQGWEEMDLRTLDVDSLYERFRNLRFNDYSDGSMRVYRQRFNQALKMQLARIDGDANWKSYGPAPSTRGSAGGKANGTAKDGQGAAVQSAPVYTPPPPPAEPQDEGDVHPAGSGTGSTPLIRFPFPLRDSVDVYLSLPRDLTKDEAERLSVFISSLARPVADKPPVADVPPPGRWSQMYPDPGERP